MAGNAKKFGTQRTVRHMKRMRHAACYVAHETYAAHSVVCGIYSACGTKRGVRNILSSLKFLYVTQTLMKLEF